MLNRRGFISSTGALLGATTISPAPVAAQATVTDPWARTPAPDSFDPWVEVIADAIRNNVRQLNRFSGCRLMAVIKNNANGIGLREIGPILDAMDEVSGLAVVRVDEALALRSVGVTKPILMMAHLSPTEMEEVVRHGVRPALYQDDARAEIERVAAATSSPVPVHVMVDTGMNRIGMPHTRALPWLADLAASPAVRIEGTFTMFSGARRDDGSQFDLEHLRRFQRTVEEARAQGIELGLLHGAPSGQIVRVPETHELDLIRPGGAIYGLDGYRRDASGADIMDIRPTFRLRARLTRVERIPTGEGVSFGHQFIAERPTWVATIPIGHTDGYPRDAAGNCAALVGDRVYPVVAVISSNHTIIEVGSDQIVQVGDIATLVGPDHPDVTPISVATKTSLGRDYWIMTKLNALLHRRVV
ncbi:MAG: alanine racemase [Vicinamibacterales bacterium]|jgi:alanine racemase|nr:alanine racemase [Acidobacteriota bacterium]MDP6371340.1 alanine racemase [Vicinamibacterales bacterium]MDP6609011.1 alanine racemase [Vicinamibacterales bacterium]HAK56727.1 alanine racemase [Acidobacteriota bacterium]|tara:strand:- start:15880 stop:17127 length:1248 start_codon:yes stop_codon:yes gene_type:complete